LQNKNKKSISCEFFTGKFVANLFCFLAENSAEKFLEDFKNRGKQLSIEVEFFPTEFLSKSVEEMEISISVCDVLSLVVSHPSNTTKRTAICVNRGRTVAIKFLFLLLGEIHHKAL
jgi:hypothetical protein